MARQLRVFNALVAAGAPPDRAAAVAAMIFASQPAAASIDSPDMTVAEVAAYRHESFSTVQRKMRAGVYVSYRSGPDKRLITRESVLKDREVCLAAGPGFKPRARSLETSVTE
jgi:hypothetical protein